MPPKLSEGRRLAEAFFQQESHTSSYWVCRCGKRRKKAATSYENLLSHIRSAHPDYHKVLSSSTKDNNKDITFYFSTVTASKYFGWFEIIINMILPFSVVENAIARKHVKDEPMSLSTFMKYLPKLTEHVEEKISAILPSKLALVFDGWSSGTTHFLALFASFPLQSTTGFSVWLLTFSPLGDESRLDSDEHVEFISYILQVYKASWANVVCLVGDNCSTNKAIADKVKKHLIGCASHRFNIAVKNILAGEEVLLDKIHVLMVKLKTLTLAAKLFKVTGLKAKSRNVTRWSSTEMVLRYDRIRESLPELDSVLVDNMSLSSAENRRVTALLSELKNLESVQKALQCDTVSLADVRGLFDAVIAMYPETEGNLSISALIVHSTLLEKAIVKVGMGNIGALSREEERTISDFALSTEDDCGSGDESHSFAERALKRQKLSLGPALTNYSDIRFLVPTSNTCERLFSRTGHVLNSRRRSMHSANFESQIFLHLNSDLWDEKDINIIIQG